MYPARAPPITTSKVITTPEKNSALEVQFSIAPRVILCLILLTDNSKNYQKWKSVVVEMNHLKTNLWSDDVRRKRGGLLL